MPSLADHHSSSVVKLLNIGESGSGKTGSLASLARAGYNLWVLDYDNGLDIVANALRDDPAALARVHFETLRDVVIPSPNGLPKVKSPVSAYKSAGKVLAEWKADTFTERDVLVLDTLTTFSDAAFNEALALAGRLNQRPQLQDYGWLADSVKLFIEMITAPELNCHVIVNTHVRYLSGEADTEIMRGLPNAKGQEISRTISRYFNTVALTRTVGSGPAAKRVISTKPQGVVEVKASNPKVKDTYPIETGLAQLFEDLLGHGPPPPSKAPSAAQPSNQALTQA
jgi:hypothetical protein